jgi:transposase-like protein
MQLLNGRKGISACQLERDLEVAYSTALRMLQQLRIAMENEETKMQFEGIVEMDETFVGGKPRKTNAVLDEKDNIIKVRKFYHKRGRGTKNPAVAGIKERSTGKVIAKYMPYNENEKRLTQKQLLEVIREFCKEGTMIMTDQYSGYKILDKKRQQKKYGHETVNHKKGQYYKGNGIHTNGIENFWSVFKRGITGMYHHVSEEYLQRYADEFSFRQNTRLDKSMFNILLKQCILI